MQGVCFPLSGSIPADKDPFLPVHEISDASSFSHISSDWESTRQEIIEDLRSNILSLWIRYALDADGTPDNTEKQTYGLSYAIYGLTEHFRATGNRESLNQAVAIFHTLEKEALDPLYGGYIESFSRAFLHPLKKAFRHRLKTCTSFLKNIYVFFGKHLKGPDKSLNESLVCQLLSGPFI